ncbi:MAG TPA: TetR family transcriptional regulator [Mycobacteriales bacterium]
MAYRRTPQVEARLEAAREAVLAAALRLLAHGGWAAVTVRAVAEEAGLSTGSVYARFAGGKDDLGVELFRTAAAREVEAVSAAPDVATAVEVFARRALARPRLAFALLAEPASEAVEAERLVFRRAHRAEFARLVAAATGRDRGDTDVVVAAAAIVGAVGEVLVTPHSTEVVPALVQLCVRALPDSALPERADR